MTLLYLFVSFLIVAALEDEPPVLQFMAAVLWPVILPVNVAVRLYHRLR